MIVGTLVAVTYCRALSRQFPLHTYARSGAHARKILDAMQTVATVRDSSTFAIGSYLPWVVPTPPWEQSQASVQFLSLVPVYGKDAL